MRKFLFKKLVRDKILPGMLADPTQKPSYRKLSDPEFIEELKKKLVEEAEEFAKSTTPEAAAEELADVVEIIQTLQKVLQISEKDLEANTNAKIAEAGGYNDRIYIESNEVTEDSKWVKYYLQQPEKYPEIE